MTIKPTANQIAFLNWEFGVFFHFGIRSFYPGHKDWDGIEMPASGFCPDKLDCEQWIRTAKNAGAKYTILTTKHHDGFALWPSKYSRYSVSDTPWKNGKGDVVKEYVDACHKYDMKVGLYYSPAQWGSTAVKFSESKEYDDYFINQITELLTGYGKIDYLWFDGCGSEGHEYDKKRIVDEIFRLQPEILTFCDPKWTPCVRWIGNEDGYASLDNPLVVNKVAFSEKLQEEQLLSQVSAIPAECDSKIRETWFYDNNEDTLKSLDELFGMYEMSVGHGSNFLLNIGPDNHGLLPEADCRRISELGEKIRNTYGNPLPFDDVTENEDGTFSISPSSPEKFENCYAKGLSNRIEICEDITNGQSITSFRIYANLPFYLYSERRILVYEGRTIGHKVICPIGSIRASKYTLEITGHTGDYKIKSMKAYFAK